MQRLHCAVATHILQRSDSDVDNITKTDEIEKLLRTATAEMPPQWWLAPKFDCSKSEEALEEVVHLMDQITHYHLLLRLHLPYLLRFSSNHQYDQSRIIAVNVSREILLRYLAFRTSNPGHFYCRGTDFLAFVAITVLSLAHVESHNQCNQPTKRLEPGAAFEFLAYSRPSDRGTMERALDIIETMARVGTDAIASKLARVIRHLLTIEASAANGTAYRMTSSKGSEGELECDGKVTGAGAALHVYIPYFGAIDFERRAISESPLLTPLPLEQSVSASSVTTVPLSDQLITQNQKLPLSCLGNPLQRSPISTDVCSFDGFNTQSTQSIVPIEASNIEDGWDLQGVDLALFSALFGETENLAGVEDESWTQWPDPG
jgi:hypothetical protein